MGGWSTIRLVQGCGTANNGLLIGTLAGSSGTLSVENGGQLNTIGPATLGLNPGSAGNATVGGTGAQWNNSSSLAVGGGGAGALTVQAGGIVISGEDVNGNGGLIGVNSGTGTVVSDGVGSDWVTQGALLVGAVNGHGSLTVQNSGALSSGVLYVGAAVGSSGTMLLQSGGIVTSGTRADGLSGSVGSSGTGVGTATIDGIGSTWNAGGAFAVGSSGNGMLTVRNGGVLNSGADMYATAGYIGVNGKGVVIVTGAGSEWNAASGIILADLGGNASLTIQNGGVVQSGADVNGNGGQIGADFATATVTIDGAGSKWATAGALLVGAVNGNGSLTLQNAGAVKSGVLYVGAATGSSGAILLQSGGIVTSGTRADGLSGSIGSSETGVGTATVDGAGSTWNASGAFAVGSSGNGALAIRNGGVVNSGEDIYGNAGYIGVNGNGVVTVTGAGSQWNAASDVILADLGGNGSLTIQNGGVVQSGADAKGNGGQIGADLGRAMVTVDGAGSKWTTSGALLVGAVNGNGSLTVENNGEVNSGVLYVGAATGSSGTILLQSGGNVTSGTRADGLSGSVGSSGTGVGTAMIDGAVRPGMRRGHSR